MGIRRWGDVIDEKAKINARFSRGKKRSAPHRSKQFPFEAELASGQTRFYRTLTDANRAMRDSQYAEERKRNETDRVVRTRIARGTRDVREVFPFIDSVQPSEQKFLRWADRRGLQVGRNGWPDFFCKSPSGGVAAVEVKSGSDRLSPEQQRCFVFLEEAGVEVFIFHTSWSEKTGAPPLIPWRKYAVHVRDTDWPGMDPGGKAAGRSKTSGKEGLDLSPPHENPAPEARRIPEVLGDPPTLH